MPVNLASDSQRSKNMAQQKAQLVLVRHGQSTWNLENRFTGWTDVDLTKNGEKEALAAGQLLKKEGFEFDTVYTSVLKRAIRTAWLIMSEMDQMWLPVKRSWKLNERHYGNLQGLNKSETAKKYGAEQVFIWRRSYKTAPPALKKSDKRHPSKDRRYISEKPPGTESLYDCYKRALPYWRSKILPDLKKGRRVLVVAHGNSLRALIKYLENISDKDIAQLNIPTGAPRAYEFNKKFQIKKSYYLGDAEKVAQAAQKVAHQAKK